jgi:hypothetical protein
LYNGSPCEKADEGVLNVEVDVRVDIDGLFSRLGDVHSVGMASRAVIGLVKMDFMGRVFIQELAQFREAASCEENQRKRTHVAARPVTPEPMTATRIESN